MDTAKIFNSGNSQAVRLPKDYRFDTDQVGINKIGNIVVLIPPGSGWSGVLNASGNFTEDFMSERNQPVIPDKRKQM